MDANPSSGPDATDLPAHVAGVHPELVATALTLPVFVVSPETIGTMRAELNARRAEMAAGARADTSIVSEELHIPGAGGGPDVRLLVYRRADHAAGGPVTLWFHGGGFIMGNAETCEPANREWVREIGGTVVSVDYRLAPEYPYPAAIEDAWAALLWVAEQAAARGWDADRIVIRGESAGGGLAAALALLARDRGGPAIRAQILIYPMLDDRTGTEPAPPGAPGTLMWPGDTNQAAWKMMLGAHPIDEDVSGHAAAARAADLAGLPPTFIGTGSLDLFHAENLDYARRLAVAGVPTATFVAPGAFHGFDSVAPETAISRQFARAARAAFHYLLAV